MEEIKVKLDIFEGPLDLLLHLIKKLEIDIYDIPIAEITEQYMNYIHAMTELELEVAGDYLVMASTLMAIKSQTLLPKQEIEFEEEEGLEGEDPREALVQQLLEYRKFKYAAEVLSEKADERSLFYTKEPMNVDEYKEKNPKLEMNQINTIDLFLAFHNMLQKRKQKKTVETTVATDESSIEEKMQVIEERLATLENGEGCSFDSFFQAETKSEVVTTFMALLELMKKHKIHVEQSGNYETIMLYAIGEEDDEIK